MRLAPDHKAVALASGERQPQGPLEEGLMALLQTGDAPDHLKYAHSIYEDSYKSEVLEAFLLVSVPADTIFEVLRVPTQVVDIYRELFFDRTVFRDELDVEVYAQSYPDDTKEQKWGGELKRAALALGLEYLTYRFSHSQPDVDIVDSLKAIITNAYMLTKASRINPLDSNAAREARQWSLAALKAMETYTRVQPMAEKSDDAWEIALQSIESTTNEAKSQIPKLEIVH